MNAYTLTSLRLAFVLCSIVSFSKVISQDFKIQHLQNDIGVSGGTNSTFDPVSSLNNAFVLANNNRKMSAGSATYSGNLAIDDLSGARLLTGSNTVTYYRQAGSRADNMRFNSSIWEYIGPSGGPNEMIIRGRYAVSLNGSVNSVTQTLNGITNANNCIPFINGIISDKTNAGGDSGTAIAYLENINTLRVEKGTNSNDVTVYVTVVEFTGSNWTVLHGDSGQANTTTGTINLTSNSNGNGSAASVSNWNETLIFCQHRGNNTNNGVNRDVVDNWPILKPGSNTQSVDWQFQSGYNGSSNRHFVHSLSHNNLKVTRFANNDNAIGESVIDISSASLSNLSEALVVGTSISNGEGAGYGKGWRNYYFKNLNEVAHWSHRNGNNLIHEIQVADLSNIPNNSNCSISTNTFPYSEDFETSEGYWLQSSNDDLNLIRDSGGTPSSGTGPSSGDGDNWYMYLEASGNNIGYPNKTSYYESPCFDLSNESHAFFHFSYHMFGADVGTLTLELSTDEGLTYPNVLRTYNGNIGNFWNQETIDLSSYVGQTVKLRFCLTSGSSASGWSSDIAIDNVRFVTTISPEINIRGNGLNIVNGDTTPEINDNTFFGSVNLQNDQETNMFIIENLGNADLNLIGPSPHISITGANASDFSVNVIPDNVISSGTSSMFSITFSPTALGLRRATLNISNDDNDENIYVFEIEGLSIPNPPEFTIYYENFDASNGNWSASSSPSTVWTHGTGLSTSGERGEGSYWYSNNYQNYDNNVYITLTSPILSTKGFENLKFNADLRYDFNSDDDDGMRLEYRYNNAGIWSNWAIVGQYDEGVYWYDGNGNVDALSNGSDGWTQSTNRFTIIPNYFVTASSSLPAVLNDKTEIQFRFVLATDSSLVDRGAAIDNIIINADPIIPFLDPLHGPGAVNSNLKLWLKATSAWNIFNDQDEVNRLPDSAYDNDAIGLVGNSPSFRNSSTENINFNPVIEFDRDNSEYLRGKGGFFSQDYFIVIKSQGTIDNSALNRQVPLAGRVAPDVPQFDTTGFALGSLSGRFTNEVVSHMTSYQTYSLSSNFAELSYGRAFTSNTINFTDEIIIYNVKTNAAGDAVEIFKNGKRIDNAAGYASESNSSILDLYEFINQQYYLGVGRFTLNGNADSYVNGKITEIISYNSKNSDLDKQKIESYLALKNGITLHAQNSTTVDRLNDINYLDSQGNAIWDTSANTGYNYDIAGIGRDDDSNFLQKQSASENKFADGTGLTSGFLTIALTDIYDTNKDNIDTNSNNFNDREYLVWGNNGVDLNSSNSPITLNLSAGITPALTTNVSFTAMQRVWKVVETGGDVSEVKVRLPQNAIRNITPPGNYYMFISDTGVFDSTADYRIMTIDGNGNLETAYDFDGTKFITFGYAPEIEVERSVYFDGNADYIDVQDNLDLNPSGFTLSAWVKRDASDSGTKSIVSKRNTAFTSGYDLRIRNDNRFEILWQNGTLQTLVGNTAIPDEQWHHVAVVFNGTQAFLYIDGVLDRNEPKTAPVPTDDSFIIAAAGKDTLTQYFRGNIDEVRVWNTPLSLDQLRFVMNQEIENNAGQVMGSALPTSITRNDINVVPWSALAGYYPMSIYTYTNTIDASGNGNQGDLRNLDTVDRQTAPLPYQSAQNGNWDNDASWLNGAMQYVPGTTSIVDTNVTVDWNIVRTAHNITMDNTALPATNNDNRTLLALYVDANEITLAGDNDTNTGNAVAISHFLNLTGKIDLEGESQLIQQTDSDLIVASNGELERDQQGTADTFTYNYWSAPVGENDMALNNFSYTVQDVMLDGINPVNFSGSGYNGAPTNPIRLADYWIWKFGTVINYNYSAWQHVRRTGLISAGEGFTMKGPGTGPILAEQNYVFLGKPNNGEITLNINAGNDYLVGNPYASAINANEFILDNTNTSGTLYFWEHWGGGSHVLSEYQGGYALYNLSGGVPAPAPDPDVAQVGVGTKTPGQYIPVAQGFFVRGISNGTINFENDQRLFKKESIVNNPSVDNRMKFRIGFSASYNMQLHRQLLLTIDENATQDADWAYDAVLNDTQTDDMYWILDNEKYIIQATNDNSLNEVYPIGIKVHEDGVNTITIDALENVPDNINIYVHDKALEFNHNLRESDYQIYLNTGEYLDRFEITFTASALSTDDESHNGLDVVYTNDKEKIVLMNPNVIEVESIKVFNMLGQLIQTIDNISESGYSEYEVKNLSSGTYIIKLQTFSSSVVTKKVLIN